MVTIILEFLDIIGSLAFALSGAIAGYKKRMDGFGITFLASVTTFGGGLTRDILLNSKPVAIFETPRYMIIAVLAGLIVRYWPKHHNDRPSLLIALFDASGLAVFTAFGTMRALELGAPFHGSIIMGMITGCVGGIIRDVLLNEPPLIFYGDFYARASLLGSLLLYILHLYGIPDIVAILSCVGLVFMIRFYVIMKNPVYQERAKHRLKFLRIKKIKVKK
ncbi:trimeric intracellular cation channel family protein [Entomospira nematocerorum]|uniref:Trimeric intracellular cation channel family protein n=1 Tax=Entomospira nematocerorum TaxID=2719987 RepID=A0A968GE15_9SPIO|nr:trimeric intracellular cation channel family protein [Entomospira nematocera]NIZ47337.1 trimeric intracellular cation channel family protein [Entomospira nematocera]WDI34121.1 trimeric intracellular cation channel family protein [Entomospira nematocera]